MFQQSKSSRTISLNARYMVLFRNERDPLQVKIHGQQMQAPYLLTAYQDATSVEHGYLIIDFHPRTHKLLKLRTDIFHRWVTGNILRGPIIFTSA